jgi:hypothetical protein
MFGCMTSPNIARERQHHRAGNGYPRAVKAVAERRTCAEHSRCIRSDDEKESMMNAYGSID